MIRTVGNYQLLEPLGEGAMGAVYRAVDTQLDREVALKALRPELARRPDIVERFREEARIQGRLESSHVVRLYQFLREGDEFFMVMEFVRGTTLSRMLLEKGRLPPDTAISIMVQALEGLDHAHACNVVHRDIKPANIMVNQQGVVKVTDFGIARLLGSARMTRVGTVVGTLEYISPEVAQGKDATAASDLYSCGVVLYELLTGSLPFRNENEYELVRMHIESPPPALRAWLPDIPRALDNAVLRALAKKPGDRYASAAEMSRALSACAQMPAAGPPGTELSFWSRLRSRALSGTSSSTSRPSPSAPSTPAPGLSDFEMQRRSAISSLSHRVDELLGQGNWEQAQTEVNRMSAQLPGDPAIVELHNRVIREQRYHAEGLQLALREGRGLLEHGLAELARNAVESSRRRYPNSTELRNLSQQVEDRLTALAAGSSEVKVIAGRVEELRRQERFQEAIDLIIEAVARLPNRPELTALLSGTVQAQKEREKNRAVEACRERVIPLQQSAHWEEAFEAVDSLLSQYPGDPALLELRAEVETERQARLRAAEVESILHRAGELRAGGQLEAAERALYDALRRFPNEPALADALTEVRAAREAARRGALADAAIARSRELRAEQEWDAALDALNAALREAPGEERLMHELAEAGRDRERHRAEVRGAIETGRALIKAQRLEDALMTLSDASQRFPRERAVVELLLDAQSRLSAKRREQHLREILTRAEDLLAAGAFGEAEELLLNAISQFPADARLTRALSAAIQGRREREKTSAVGECLERVGQLTAEGRIEAALEELNRVLALYPSESSLEPRRRELAARLREERRVALLARLQPRVEADLKQGSFGAPLSAIAEALREYPGDAELLRLQTTIQETRRAFQRERAEVDAAQRTSELESRQEFAAAIQLVKSALDYYPESERLTVLRDQLQERWDRFLRERKAAAAESATRRLLDAGDLRGAVAEVRKELAGLPGWPSLVALEAEATAALRDAEAAETTRRVEDAIAARGWAAAESAVQEFEQRHGEGEGEFCGTLRKKIASERGARRKALDKALTGALSLVKDGDFAAAIAALEPLDLEAGESEPFAVLLGQAREGLKRRELDRALLDLRNRVTGALERDDVAAAMAALEDTRQALGESPVWRELEGRVLREQGVASALANASRHLAARAWEEGLAEIESARGQFGDDPRLASLARQIHERREDHQRLVDTALAEARTLSDSGDHEGAVRRLTGALTAVPGEPLLEGALAEARLSLSAWQRAERLRGMEAETRSLLSSGETERAETLVEAALRELPGDRQLFDLLRDVRAAQRRKKAVEDTELLAGSAIAQRRWAEAEAAVADFERRFSADEFGVVLRNRIEEARRARRQHLDERLAEASALTRTGDFAAAMRILEAPDLDSGERPPFERLLEEARASLRKRKIERGVAELNRAVEDALERGDIAAAMALLAAARSEFGSHEAWSALERRVLRERNIARALRQACEDEAAHAWDAALRVLDAASGEAGGDARLAELASRIQGERDRRRAAVEAVLTEVRSLLETNQPDEALQRLTRAIEETPDEPQLLEAMAETRHRVPIEQRAARLRSVEATARSLMSSGQPEEAEAFVEESLRELPGESSIHALLKESRAAQRRKKAIAEMTRAADEAMAGHRWTAAESAIQSFERRHGADPLCAGLREKLTKAREDRREILDTTLAEASSRMKERDFAGALDIMQRLDLAAAERDLFAAPIKQAQAGLKQQKIDRKLQELRERVSDAVATGDFAAAHAALAGGRQEFGRSAAWRELDAEVRRQEGISEGLRRATAHAAAGRWAQALADAEVTGRQFGEDQRLTELVERVRREQEAHRDAVETALAEARALAESGAHQQAVQWLTRAVEETGGDPLLDDALKEARLAGIEASLRPLLSSGRFESAEALLAEALRDLPEDAAVLALLEEARSGRRRSEQIAQYANTVQERLDAGDAARAESVLLEAVRKFPGVPALLDLRGAVEVARLREWREKAIQAALSISRRNLTENRFEDARRVLASARQEHGEDARLDAPVPEIDAAEQRKASLDRVVAQVADHLRAGRYSPALQLLEGVPEWARGDATITGLAAECRRLAEQQAAELERVTARAESLMQKGLFDDALVVLEGASRDQRVQEPLRPLLERARELREQAGSVAPAGPAIAAVPLPSVGEPPAPSSAEGSVAVPGAPVRRSPERREAAETRLSPEPMPAMRSGDEPARGGAHIVWNLEETGKPAGLKLSEQIAALSAREPELSQPGPASGHRRDFGTRLAMSVVTRTTARLARIVREHGISGPRGLRTWARRWWPW
jgi:serine/threonine protein kinase